MKKTIVLGILVSALFACSNSDTNKTEEKKTEVATENLMYFGDKITADSAVALADLKTLMGANTEFNVKLVGAVEDVCQKKGCWMNLKDEAGNSIRITFKDYGFFMPKDCAGKTAIVNGIAKVEETSVADLQEYAKDAGEDKDAIAAIKEPKKELVFEASGVILK